MPGETVAQEPMLAMIMCGSRLPEAWSAKAEAVDFYDLKGEIEALLGGAREACLSVPRCLLAYTMDRLPKFF